MIYFFLLSAVAIGLIIEGEYGWSGIAAFGAVWCGIAAVIS